MLTLATAIGFKFGLPTCLLFYTFFVRYGSPPILRDVYPSSLKEVYDGGFLRTSLFAQAFDLVFLLLSYSATVAACLYIIIISVKLIL